MLASATGERMSVKRFNIAAVRKKMLALKMVNAQTKPTDRTPLGIARILVRGLRVSYSRSAMRLKDIAVDRAPTIAMVIQTICQGVGIPRAANTAPRKANGSANSVCSILIISSVVRMFLKIELMVEAKRRTDRNRYARRSRTMSQCRPQASRPHDSRSNL